MIDTRLEDTMDVRETLQRVNTLMDAASRRFGSIAPLATRLIIGMAFFQAGLGKWQNLDRTIGFFESLGIPLPAFNVYLVASMELIGGIALILGLATRFFASGLSVTMVVALLTAHPAEIAVAFGGGDTSPTDIVALTFLLFLLWLIAYGAGMLSLDAVLRRVLRTELRPNENPGPPVAEQA
jgi:putative oxidoreductase